MQGYKNLAGKVQRHEYDLIADTADKEWATLP